MPVPVITHSGSPACQQLVDQCPLLAQDYTPPKLWGKNGHCQSIVFSLKGRFGEQKPINGTRFYLKTADGATASFDVFEPTKEQRGETEKENGAVAPDLTACIAPGIGNSSETDYIRSHTAVLQRRGYRVAVQNHLGALRNETLTAPRIFSWGATAEFRAMIRQIGEKYPQTKIVTIGFSMGGNLVTKAAGEMDAEMAASSHYETKPGHFETSKIHFPTSEGVSEVSERANE